MERHAFAVWLARQKAQDLELPERPRDCYSRFMPPTVPKRWTRVCGDGSLYQGRSSGNVSATVRKPPTIAMASTKKTTTTSSPRVIGFPTGPMHFVRCATACLFTTDRNECSQKKTLRLDSQNWVQRHEGWRGPGVSPPPLGTEAFQRRTGGHFTLGSHTRLARAYARASLV